LRWFDGNSNLVTNFYLIQSFGKYRERIGLIEWNCEMLHGDFKKPKKTRKVLF